MLCIKRDVGKVEETLEVRVLRIGVPDKVIIGTLLR